MRIVILIRVAFYGILLIGCLNNLLIFLYNYAFHSKPIVVLQEADYENQTSVEYTKWAINLNILQYSTFVVQSQNVKSTAYIESIFAFGFQTFNEGEFTNDTQFIYTKQIKCVLKHRLVGKLYYIFNTTKVIPLFGRPMTTGTQRLPWKAVCEVKNLASMELYHVAIIDYNQHLEKSLIFNISDAKMYEHIQFQVPKMVTSGRPKEKAIAHCVHGIQNLNEKKVNKLMTWLKLQQSLGYAEIKLYFFDNTFQISRLIYEKFNKSFVKIVQHELTYEHVCEFYIYKWTTQPDDFISSYLHSHCSAIYSRSFDLTQKDDTNFLHGRSQTNDCYLQFRHKYEYVTNYDFDEVLLPRKYAPFYDYNNVTMSNSSTYYNANLTNNDTYLQCDGLNGTNETFTYSMYDYANTLFRLHSRTSNDTKQLVSSIEFECLPYFPNNEYVQELFQRLTETVDKVKEKNYKKFTFIRTLRTNYTHYPRTYKRYINYFVNHTDMGYLENLLDSYEHYKCFKAIIDPAYLALELPFVKEGFLFNNSIFGNLTTFQFLNTALLYDMKKFDQGFYDAPIFSFFGNESNWNSLNATVDNSTYFDNSTIAFGNLTFADNSTATNSNLTYLEHLYATYGNATYLEFLNSTFDNMTYLEFMVEFGGFNATLFGNLTCLEFLDATFENPVYAEFVSSQFASQAYLDYLNSTFGNITVFGDFNGTLDNMTFWDVNGTFGNFSYWGFNGTLDNQTYWGFNGTFDNMTFWDVNGTFGNVMFLDFNVTFGNTTYWDPNGAFGKLIYLDFLNSTDGYRAYLNWINVTFGNFIDFNDFIEGFFGNMSYTDYLSSHPLLNTLYETDRLNGTILSSITVLEFYNLTLLDSNFDLFNATQNQTNITADTNMNPFNMAYFDSYNSSLLHGQDTNTPINAVNPYENYIDSDFNNGIVSAYNVFGYHGKSIFNTQYTEHITFHYGVGKDNTVVVNIPVDYGFVSHFRDDLEKYFLFKNVSITKFFIDIEYYKFFLKNIL